MNVLWTVLMLVACSGFLSSVKDAERRGSKLGVVFNGLGAVLVFLGALLELGVL